MPTASATWPAYKSAPPFAALATGGNISPAMTIDTLGYAKKLEAPATTAAICALARFLH
jgi:hypothetical protein